MSGLRIVNASPLITLAKAGAVSLLTAGGTDVRIPEAVVAEVAAGPDDDPARRLLESGFGTRLPNVLVPASVLEWGLGAGESAVIAEALRTPASVAVLDDAAARRCARSFGVGVIGTLGIILVARREGEIAAAGPMFAAVRNAGLFFDDELAGNVLAAVGETWPPR